MPKRYFKGRIDLDSLTPEDRSRVEQALATLQELDARGLIECMVGHSREWKTLRLERKFTITPQRERILDLLRQCEWATVRDIAAATGMVDSSIGPNLTALLKAGLIERTSVEWPERKYGRKTQFSYRLRPSGPFVPSPAEDR